MKHSIVSFMVLCLVFGIAACGDPVGVYKAEFVVGFQYQTAPYVGFTYISDTYMKSDDTTADNDSAGVLYVGNTGTFIGRALFKFNIFGLIPGDATITKAVLTTRLNAYGTGVAVSAHEMTEQWYDGACWDNNGNGPWNDGPGGSFDPQSMGTAVPDPALEGFYIELDPTVVQKWIRSYMDNKGFMIKADNETIISNLRITSSEQATYSFNPRLTIYFKK